MPFDGSGETVTGYKWILPNATFINGTSETSENPEVVYDQTGTFDATLIVSSASYSDTLEVEDYIEIRNFEGTSSLFFANFESQTAFNNQGWEFYPAGSWELVDGDVFGGYGKVEMRWQLQTSPFQIHYGCSYQNSFL